MVKYVNVMKNLAYSVNLWISLFFLFLFQSGFSTVWIIQASNYVFTPSELPSVQLGDTIRWIWIEGIHTTTSTMIPLGASQWDAPLTESSPFYDYIPPIPGKYNYECTLHASSGMFGYFTVMETTGISFNTKIDFAKIHPNPFTTSTTIEYTLNSPQTVTITFYNSFGGVVDIIKEHQQQGVQKVIWTPGDLDEGIYYIRMEAGCRIARGKVVLVR